MTSDHNLALDERLTAIFATAMGIALESVTPDCSPETVDSWDSFGHLRLITAVEKEFGLTLSMEQITGIDSLAKLISTVRGAT